MNHEHPEVSIIIDKKHKRSPNPTTGHALYVLGEIGPGYDLNREVPGQGDDEPVPDNDTVINLKNGDHFFSSPSDLNPGNGDGK